MKNILVGIEFDGLTDKLIDHALSLADKKSTMIWLLHVAAPEPDFVGYEVGPQYIRNSRADVLKEEMEKLSTYAKKVEQLGFQADGLLIQGATAKTILDESEKLHIDLIILGRQHHNFLYDIFFGSTAEEIIRRSNIPVLVIPDHD